VTLERGYVVTICLAFVVMTVLSRLLLHTEQYPTAWMNYCACGYVGIVTSYLFLHFTKLYTDYNYHPVQRIALASLTGHGTNVIAGISVGLESTGLPTITCGAALLISFWLGQSSGLADKTGHLVGGLYGTAIATMGMLSTAVYILAMDTFGPITDNAGGIVEMSQQSEAARLITDRLDAVGNVTKATTKGYSIGAAALASFLLLRAFLDVAEEFSGETIRSVDFAVPEVFVAGLCGGMLIFIFAGLAMSAVGRSASEVVDEVRRQFDERPGIMDYTERPDYARCVSLVTRSALREMVKPGLLAVLTPIAVGVTFRIVGQNNGQPLLGVAAIAGFLLFSTATGILMALFLNNSGGAFDNAKKYIETGAHGGKRSFAHQSAVTGDTLGDPCKDTAGPSIHVLIKLLSTIALVMCPLFIG
jgi:inorganic pyrophosphatase